MSIKVYKTRQLAQIEANVKNSRSRKWKWIVVSISSGGYAVVKSGTQFLGGAR